jgi:hypothetical protein
MKPKRHVVAAVLLVALAVPAIAACARSAPNATLSSPLPSAIGSAVATQPSPLPSATEGAPSRAEMARALRTIVAQEAPDFDVGSIERITAWRGAQGRWHVSAQLNPPPIASSNSIRLVIVKRGQEWRRVTLAYVPPGPPPTIAPVVVGTP